jgi:hypothetical protein
MERFRADSERVLDRLIGSRAEAIERNREAGDT